MIVEKEKAVYKKTSRCMCLLLLFAVCAGCIYLGLELVDEPVLWVQRQAGRATEAFAILLLYVSVKAGRDETLSVQKCIFLSISAILISCLAFFWRQNWLTVNTGFNIIGIFLLITAPVYVISFSRIIIRKIMGKRSFSTVVCCMPCWTLMIVVCAAAGIKNREEKALLFVWLVESIIWGIALQSKAEGKERKRRLWVTWMVCLGLFLCSSCLEGIGGEWYLFVRLQEPVLMICLPFVYQLVFRKRDRGAGRESDGKWFLSGLRYFGISFVLYLFMNGISYMLAERSGAYPIDLAIYYVLWCVFVFVSENKGAQKEKMAEGKTRNRIYAYSFLPAVFYIVGCWGIMIVRNSRVRDIFHSLMKRGTGFKAGGYVDWLGYRMSAVRCFISGKNHELDTLFLPSGSNGYLYFESGSSAGGLFFRQGHIWMWLISVLVLAVVLVLLSWKWGSPVLNRCKNYLAISYFIRLLLSIFCIVGMVNDYHIEMPFTRYVMVDGLLLVVILLKRQSSDPHVVKQSIHF